MDLNEKNLVQKYIKDDLTINECALFFNCSKSTIIGRMNKWNIHKDLKQVSERRKQTNRKLYGGDFPFSSDEIQKKAHNSHDYIKGGQTLSKANKKERIKRDKERLEKANKLIEKFRRENNRGPTNKELSFLMGLNRNLVRELIKGTLDRKLSIYKSKFENEVKDFLNQNNIQYVLHDRTQIKPQELDFYIPKYKVALELNDIASHNSTINYYKGKLPKDKFYHFNKSKECSNKGIRLIHIWDYEWNDERKQKIFKSLILSACNHCSNRYYARQCQIKVYKPENKEWSKIGQFFFKNNMQGNRGGKVVYALEKDNQILMAYKFGRPFSKEAKKKYEWEMVRGAAASNTQIIGGATKLWKHFINDIKPKSIIYYVDFNYFDGKSVEKLGGKLIGTQLGVKNYWVSENKVKNREPLKHKEIQEKIKNFEVLELYNSGTKTYIFEF